MALRNWREKLHAKIPDANQDPVVVHVEATRKRKQTKMPDVFPLPFSPEWEKVEKETQSAILKNVSNVLQSCVISGSPLDEYGHLSIESEWTQRFGA